MIHLCRVTSPIWRQNTPQHFTYTNQSYPMYRCDSFNESWHMIHVFIQGSHVPHLTTKYASICYIYESVISYIWMWLIQSVMAHDACIYKRTSRPPSDDEIRLNVSHVWISHILCVDMTHSMSHVTPRNHILYIDMTHSHIDMTHARVMSYSMHEYDSYSIYRYDYSDLSVYEIRYTEYGLCI